MSKECWEAQKPILDGLTIQKDGDILEKHAEYFHFLRKRMPNYEAFWRYVICPASDKPKQVVGFRKEASKEIRRISQLSYSTLQNLIQSDKFASAIQVGDFGFFDANIQCCIIFSGNALQLMSEVQKEIEEGLGQLLKAEIKIFSSDKKDFLKTRDRLVKYRNYFTHSGLILKIAAKDIPGVSFIPKPEKIISTRKESTVWVYTDELSDFDETDYVRFDFAAVELKNEIWNFVDACYQRFLQGISPHLHSDVIQKAWGWK